MSYTLISPRIHAEGAHRSGWPKIYAHLAARATGKLVLDDFFDLNFNRPDCQAARLKPWVGIFHFPPELFNSPVRGDQSNTIHRSLRQGARHLNTLRGVITLSENLAEYLRNHFGPGMPVLVLKHPTDYDCELWQASGKAVKRLFQAGFFLRDTRAIFKIQREGRGSGWEYYRSAPHVKWQLNRDTSLRSQGIRQEWVNPGAADIIDVPRCSDAEYDEWMKTCVCLTHLFGASANNVVVECIARGTPLVVNKLPAVVEYLGADYPLYFDPKQIKYLHRDVLKPDKIMAAHEHMMRLRCDEQLTPEYFAEKVHEFCAKLS